jgi:hypothetical protein
MEDSKMVNLDKYKKVKIYFFGNESEKQIFLKEFLAPYFRRRIPGRYFINRDWNGGPNYEIIFSSKLIDEKELQEEALSFCNREGFSWTKDQIDESLAPYRKNQDNLLQMERKNSIGIPIDSKNHLKAFVEPLNMDYYRASYNSSEHVKLHFKSRFFLQPLLEATLKKITDKDALLIHIIHIYRITMKLFSHGEKYASLMFYSNIAGVFAIAKQYKADNALKENYDKLYKRLDIDSLDTLPVDKRLLGDYHRVWENIYELSQKLYQKGGFSEEGYLSIEEQGERMKNNVSGIGSEFHEQLISGESIDQMITSETHIVFRSITNLLYNILPSLNINFLEKNFCCYAITEFIAKEYKTSWKEIFKERMIG